MEMHALTKLLHENNYSCVIGNEEIRAYTRRGVADIYGLLYDNWRFLSGASVADRVVGKAAAALLALGGVRQVHADVISIHACSLLLEYGIEVEYGEAVCFIWNRDHTDLCPLEKLCKEEKDPMKILGIIDKFMIDKAS